MALFEILDANGSVEHRCEGNEAGMMAAFPGKSFRLAAQQNTGPTRRVIAKIDFRDRFTQAEKESIHTAAKTSAKLAVWLEDIQSLPAVDLSAELVVKGVQAMESQGIIAAGRSAVILA